jgi:acetylornithine deacetylase/succinyl-diaminopimelate desuccinylase-like protein
MTSPDELRERVRVDRTRAVEELSRLVEIPSIAFPGYDDAPVRASAQLTAEILEAAGLDGVRLIELPDVGHPAVFGEVRGPAGADRATTSAGSSCTRPPCARGTARPRSPSRSSWRARRRPRPRTSRS